MSTPDSRITELEIRVAHQEKMITELNDVITDQWKKLELLERNLRRLGEEMESLGSTETPGNQKPPHY